MLVLSEVRVYLDALGAMLREQEHRNTIRMADSLCSALLDMTSLQADVFVFDVRAGGALRSVPAMQRRWPTTRLLAFGLESSSQQADCVAAGVSATLPRHAPAGEFLRALGQEPRGRAPAATPTPTAPATQLTVREQEVAALMARGLSNKEIARSLDIAVATTKNHVHCILEKLHTHSRLQAVLRLGAPLA